MYVFPNRLWLAKAVKQKLTDIFLNEWDLELEIRPSAHIYRIFKLHFIFENCLTNVPFSLRKYLIKFRTLNHKPPPPRPPVGTGRWRNVSRVERKCHLCSSDICDEYRYLMICKNSKSIRKKCLTYLYIIVNDRILINLKN